MSRKDINQILSNIYYTPENPGGFSSLKELYDVAKKINPNIKLKHVKYFLRNKKSFYMHYKKRKKIKRRKTITNGMFDLFQADLIVLPNLKKYNDGFSYILTCIDCFSRVAFVEPMKSKTAGESLRAFKIILKKFGNKPNKLQTDAGSEFKSIFRTFLKNNNIKYYSTYSEIKAALVERFNITLLTILHRYFTSKSTYRYIDVIHKIVNNYNTSKHSTLGIAPFDVNSQNEAELWNKLYHKYLYDNNPKFDFKVNEPVLITKYKNIFFKGYKNNWAREIFYISHRLKTKPVTYILKDKNGENILGSFYSQELNKVG